MKELTIEEKARRYDEIIERAKIYYRTTNSVADTELIELLFPEFAELEDERIIKGIIRCVEGNMPDNDFRKKYLAWLEKQFEQKPAEPKFKGGDWVVNNNGEPQLFQVISSSWPDSKIKIVTNNLETFINTVTLDKQYHLWTIQDAKNGDILTNWYNTIFIFKAIEDETVKFHIAYNDDWGTVKTPLTESSHLGLPEPQFGFQPATEEQRDILEKTMSAAGYTFDFKNKELKKMVS